MTRLKDPARVQLLIFKELSWQTVRIEAKSTKDRNLTPLRLLTNQARCRITIKKRLSGRHLGSNNHSVLHFCTLFRFVYNGIQVGNYIR